MLSHVLDNDPRVGYAHQTNLIADGTGAAGSATQNGYTILALINDMLAQYQSWTTTPLVQVNDATDAQYLGLQSAWATAQASGKVAATEQNGVINVTNTTGATVSVPLTAPAGTTVNGAAFGQSYGGAQSTWTSVTTSGVSLDASIGVLNPGSQLNPGEGITSPSGQYSIVMQADGNFVEYDGAASAWATGTNTTGSVIDMQTDGNLVIYSGTTAKWASGTSGNAGAYLVLGNNGILTIDSASGVPIWGATGILVPGQVLAAGQSITSPNHTYRLTMQSDGNLVEYDGAASAWATGTNTTGSTLLMQSDGNLVMYSAGTPKWASGTNGNTGAYLVLGDNGVLSVDSSSGVALWGGVGVLTPGAQLAAGQSITSPNHTYRLTMQSDGNLVEYDGAASAWATGTNTTGSTLLMQSDGNLVMYSAGTPKWASGTNGNTGAYLVLGDNGVLSVDSSSGVALWGGVGVLTPGAQLAAGQSITSPNHTYRLTMQSDGNLVEYDGAAVKWASGTNTAGSTVTMQTDGNLVIYSAGIPKWATNTAGYPGAYLSLSDTGVLSVNASGGLALWG